MPNRKKSNPPKKGIIVFDLDGTLVDHWLRMYRLYSRYMCRVGKIPAVLGQYRAWKISGENEKNIAMRLLTESEFSGYLKWKTRHIEDAEFLALDRLIPDVKPVLERLSRDWTLVVLTSRHHKILTGRQLDTIGIRKYFHRIIVAPGTDYAEEKFLRISRYLNKHGWISGNPPMADNGKIPVIFVGDSEREIEIAHRLQAVSIAIASGVRGYGYLKAKNPDLTLQTIKNLPLAIDKIIC